MKPLVICLLTVWTAIGISGNDVIQVARRCVTKETCKECIQEGPECAWCAQENYTALDVPQCDLETKLRTRCNNVVDPSTSIEIIKEEPLSEKSTSDIDVVQIKPQIIKLRLKPSSSKKFTVQFRQAVDYPVDLYYVMDLSHSMKDDKENLAKLGNKLASEMENITSNFKLGFGSFVDKVTAPYVNTHPTKLRQPCQECAAPYGFKNQMPLSSNTKEFAKRVMVSKVSGNLDGVEGGFDAIMQAVVCHREIGWRNKSRKLLVLSTDNGFHCAGDGKMAGIVSPNDEQCHLDQSGTYTMSTLQDYPSYTQINRQIKENKVNIIFAVTKDQVNLYNKLSNRLVGSSTARLNRDSSNIVKLIRDQYERITSSVEMTSNLKVSNIQLEFESSCLSGTSRKTNICHGLRVGDTVSFEVTVELLFCTDEPQNWNQTFEIFPVGLNEQLTIQLEAICECDCAKPWNEERNSSKCSSGAGSYSCGACSCYGSRFGKECECDGSSVENSLEEHACVPQNETRPCSDRGECRCGVCHCFKRANADEKVTGKYCECDDFSCDKKNNKVCGGPSQGVCDCGKCRCHGGWTGKDCGCRTSQTNCINSAGVLCSGHGICECGACVCNVTDKEYFGKHCDDCKSCPGKCTQLRSCVECEISRLKDRTFFSINCTLCDVPIFPVDKLDGVETAQEKLCTFHDDEGCKFYFKYSIDDDDGVVVHMQKGKDCPAPLQLTAIVSGVVGGVVGVGLLLLLLLKLLTEVHDRREYVKYVNELEKSKWDAGENPIYKPSVSTFENPMFRTAR